MSKATEGDSAGRPSRSSDKSRRDRGHGSERCHESSRFHHSTRHRESGEQAQPTSSSGGSSSRSKQADVTDVRPSTSTHHQHHHSPCPLHLRHRLLVPRLKLETAIQLSRSSDKKKTLLSGVSVVGRSRSDGGPMPSRTNESERHRLRSGVWGRRGSRVGEI